MKISIDLKNFKRILLTFYEAGCEKKSWKEMEKILDKVVENERKN